MLSKQAIEYFKKNWYSFEQIEWIKKGLIEAKNWEVVSKDEMDNFIKSDLFSKYTTHV